jgi:hypothetical protein
MCIDQPDAALLTEAARQGVMLVVKLKQGASEEQLIAITQCPAIMLVIVDETEAVEGLRGWLPNIVIAKGFDPATMEQPPPDADALLLAADGQLPADLTACGTRPVIGLQKLAESVDDVAAARAACDQMQRDLAGRYDLSGYIVEVCPHRR